MQARGLTPELCPEGPGAQAGLQGSEPHQGPRGVLRAADCNTNLKFGHNYRNVALSESTKGVKDYLSRPTFKK